MAWFVASQYADSDKGTYVAPDVTPVAEDTARFQQSQLDARDGISERWKSLGRPEDHLDFPFFGVTGVPSLVDGWRWPDLDQPLRARVTSEGNGDADIINSGFGSYAISSRVVELIEAVEPGVHRYLPFQLLNENGSVRSDDFRILNICSRAECIDTDRSNVSWRRTGIVNVFGDVTIDGGERYVVVKSSCVKGRAAWSEWRYSGARSFMVSDALWDMLRREGVQGWQPHFSYPEHIQEISSSHASDCRRGAEHDFA